MTNNNGEKVYYLGNNEKFQNKQIYGSPDDNFYGKLSYNNDGDGGGGDMGNRNYVTHKELELTKESIERKIDCTESNLKKVISDSVVELKKEMTDQRKINIRWTIGTAIALGSLLVAVAKLFIPS